MDKNEFLKTGLSQLEATELLKQHGENVIKNHKKLNVFKVFISQFKDFMIILLLIAAAISFGVAIWQFVSKHPDERGAETIISFVEPFIILIVVALNSALGAYQEIKSDQAVKALEKNNELSAKVMRDGIIKHIPSHLIVPGDLIVVESGDIVPADAKILQSNSLRVVEAFLTGESLPVDKNSNEIENVEQLALGDRLNYLYSGSQVVNGRAFAVVTKTGLNTEIGALSKLIQDQEVRLTPLQIKLNKLSKIFGIAGVVLLFVTLAVQIVLSATIAGNWTNPQVYSNSLIIGISLAVAAIPEGLITFTTVLLAIGVSRMTKENVIIKAFNSVETFGSTSVICSDKTGTLTQNKMQVTDFFESRKSDSLENSKVLQGFVACCDAKIQLGEDGQYHEVGDPTEIAIMRYAMQHNITQEQFYSKNMLIDSLPFDSDRKMMSILVQTREGDKVIITKGAPDVIFSRSKNMNDEYARLNEEYSNNAYRVIALGFKKVNPETTKISHEDEKGLFFLGLVAMFDPPREEAKHSIAEAKKAGIKTVMITGDHLTTAKAIAKDLEIFNPDQDIAITGAELAKLSDEELKQQVKNISVYARVNPEDKLRIVKAWQSHHEVVAMTGDGVNDAPALKAADLGCAMGITGTDVSKQAADVILTDDNFSTIVTGVKSGRYTYSRIKTVILNLLVSSISEIIVMFIGLFVFRFLFQSQIQDSNEFIVLSASQLLWINLLTHGLPAIALGMTPSDVDVMSFKPINKHESVFAGGMGTRLIIQSSIIGFAALASYLVVGFLAKSNNVTKEEFIKLTSSACFLTLGIASSVNLLNLMSKNNIALCSFKKYKLVYLASASSLILILAVAFIPGLSSLFNMFDYSATKLETINHGYWIIPLVLSFTGIIYEENVKLYQKLKQIILA
ncbi:cation-translocating P-type ATPase [Mycoplasma corogypsi]|uniref:cation-translocating P-type ATPase n=1 Tax=Mycoplasma corogypsi TaxID=2106 RepID=UPI003872D435